MEKQRIHNNLKQIYNLEKIDGRTKSALRRQGYLTKEDVLTSLGYRVINEYRHIPQLPLLDPVAYKNQNALVIETILNYDDTSFEEEYTISVEKLAKKYNEYAALVNQYVIDWCWDHTLDEQIETGWTSKDVQKQMLRIAENEVRFYEFSYTWHILKQLMQDIIDGKNKSYISTNHKYSITDTQDEIGNLKSEGPSTYIMNVEVNL